MKHTRRIIMAVAFALSLTNLPNLLKPVGAQEGVFDMGILTNTLSLDHLTQSERKRARDGSSLKSAMTRSVRAAETTPKLSRAPRTLGTFTSSAAIRERNIASFLNTMSRIDPQNAASLEKDFATKDIFGDIGRKMETYGLKTNSVADAMAVYLVVAWKATRGSNDEGTKAQYLAVREQMARAMAEVPAVASATDANKQELADSLLLHALLIDSYVNGAKSRPALMPNVKAAVAQGARASFGFDLIAFNLTDQGLRL
ncbi:MAG: DUF6683 family protein [Pyrinomonadaceae bacterium]